MIDVTEHDGFANIDLAFVRLFLRVISPEQGCFASSVWTDNANNSARRQSEIELVTEQLVAVALNEVTRLDY